MLDSAQDKQCDPVSKVHRPWEGGSGDVTGSRSLNVHTCPPRKHTYRQISRIATVALLPRLVAP